MLPLTPPHQQVQHYVEADDGALHAAILGLEGHGTGESLVAYGVAAYGDGVGCGCYFDVCVGALCLDVAPLRLTHRLEDKVQRVKKAVYMPGE
jgi:hypothetical protein